MADPWQQRNDPESTELPPSLAATSAPEGYVGVWPPVPETEATAPVWIPFQFIYMRLSGAIADFREGQFGLDSKGITIDGKTMVRSEIYNAVIVFGILFCTLAAIVGHFIMRYAMLSAARLGIPWHDVKRIVLVPDKLRVGIEYNAPNYKGTIKPYCFCVKLTPSDYTSFVALASQYAGDRTAPGKIKSGVSLIVWILLGLLVALITFVLILTVVSTLPSTRP